VTSSDAPPPPDGPPDEDQPDGSVPPVHEEPVQSRTEAELQEENAGTSLDQPSQ
jgi:hypothetical protein